MAKAQSGKSQSRTWALQVLSIEENTRQGGIEIRFDAEPSPQLQPKLRVMGFRHSRTKTMWYGDNTQQAKHYAEQLKAELPARAEGPELFLSPSLDAVKTNIEKKEFSFVMFTLKDGKTTNYILFEPSKPRAEVIASNFAKEQFGDQLIAMAVLPRTHIKEARTLYDEGKVISPGGSKTPILDERRIKQEPAHQTVDKNMDKSSKSDTGNQTPSDEFVPADKKIPMQLIQLTAIHEGVIPDYAQGVQFKTWAEADEHIREALIGRISDVYFKVTWRDEAVFEHSIDLEPSDFYDNNQAPLSWFVRNYFTYLSQQEPSFLATRKQIVNARHMLTLYLMEDKVEYVESVKNMSEGVVDEPLTDISADEQRQLERQALDQYYKWAIRQDEIAMKPREITRERLGDWFKENVPNLTNKSIDRIWTYHLGILNTLEDQSRYRKRSLRHPFDSIYKKILKIIPRLIEHIKAGKRSGKSRKDPKGGLMDLNFDFLYHDEKGRPVIALSHYFKQEGDMIADPDMQIRLIPEMEIAEALTYQDQFGFQEVYKERDGKMYANDRLRNSQNRFLNQWLTNLIHQGHKIDLSADEPKDNVAERSRERLTEQSGRNDPEVSQAKPTQREAKLWSLIHQLIEGLELLQGAEQKGKIEISNGQGHRVIEVNLNPYGKESDFRLTITDTLNTVAQFQSSTWLKPKLQAAAVSSVMVKDEYAKLYIEQKDLEVNLTGITSDSEEMNQDLINWLTLAINDRHSIQLSVVTEEAANSNGTVEKASADDRPFDPEIMARLIAADKYLKSVWILSQKSDVLNQVSFTQEQTQHLQALFNIYVLQDAHMLEAYNALSAAENSTIHPANDDTVEDAVPKSIAVDLYLGEVQVPNVLVPVNTSEPFYSHEWTDNIQEVLKRDFPHLLQLKEEDLANARPIELFELIQLSHPSEYGIDIARGSVLEEWERRGKDIFREIGFPIEGNYPYVNLNTGYRSVETLDNLLYGYEGKVQKWWSIAENARPIADIRKGVAIIDKLMADRTDELNSVLNPKTKKPKNNHKEQAADLDYILRRLKKSKQALVRYLSELPEDKQGHQIANRKPPLTNDSGVYTKETAGENFEEIIIPMPKTSQYTAEIQIAETSGGFYKKGITAMKRFGDYTGRSYAPSVSGPNYQSRRAALRAGLLEHEEMLEHLLKTKDGILNNDEKKNKQLSMALKAVIDFAQENGIDLDETSPEKQNQSVKGLEESESETQASINVTSKEDEIIHGLEEAYWQESDNHHPVDKTTINGQDFHQARLRELIRDKLTKMSLQTSEQVANELGSRFRERQPLSSYEKGRVTIGKTGDKRKAVLTAWYVDDIIIDHDLAEKIQPPVMSFLLELLFSGTARMVDKPQGPRASRKTGGSVKKQSQHEINREIELLIDEKDKTGLPYNEEEKNHLRLYTGSGGLLAEGAKGRGTLYEYYTPDGIVRKMWDMAYHYGYDGGSVLEPAVGTGNFLKYAPKGAQIIGFETNHYAARIGQILHPHATIHEKAFETHFFAGNIHLKDKFVNPGYSLVIGNPPYGAFTGKYAGLGEKRHTQVTEYDQYFTLRSLDLLKPGGLLIFLVPSHFMLSMQKYDKIKRKIIQKAEWVDGYRFPSGAVPNTEEGTDVIVLRKRI